MTIYCQILSKLAPVYCLKIAQEKVNRHWFCLPYSEMSSCAYLHSFDITGSKRPKRIATGFRRSYRGTRRRGMQRPQSGKFARSRCTSRAMSLAFWRRSRWIEGRASFVVLQLLQELFRCLDARLRSVPNFSSPLQDLFGQTCGDTGASGLLDLVNAKK